MTISAISDACSGAELLLGPLARVRRQAFGRDARRIPRVVEEELDRELHRLEVADVDDPDPVGARLVREVHLLPDARDLVRVDPLVVARPADVVEVVVDAVAARPLAIRRVRAAAGCCPSCRRRRAASRRPARACPCRSSPALPCRAPRAAASATRRVARDLGDDLPLVGDDALEQGDVACPSVIGSSPSPRMPSVTMFSRVAHALDALAPERAQASSRSARSSTARARSAATPAARASSARGATCPSRCRTRRRAPGCANRRRRTRSPTSPARGSCP